MGSEFKQLTTGKTALAAATMLALAMPAIAGTSISGTPVFTHEGEVGYVTAAVALRSSWHNANTSHSTGNNSMTVNMPSEGTVRQAILYWGTDKPGGDDTVTLSGNTVTSDADWYDLLSIGYNSQYYYGYRADVTNIVTGNGTYTFRNLEHDTWIPFLGACLNGAILIVIYDAPSNDPNRLNRIDVFEGFEAIRGSGGASGGGSATASLPLNLSNATKVMATTMSWQGNSKDEWSGYKDSLVVNGTSLSGSGNPSDDAGNGSGAGGSANSQYAVDCDTFDVTAAAAGASSLSFTNTSIADDYVIVQGFVLGAAGGIDASDAPVASYGLATHSTVGNSLTIGTLRDEETLLSTYAGDSQAMADDNRGTDDEDGLLSEFPRLDLTMKSYTLTVNCSPSGALACWIDFDQSGTFEANERTLAVDNSGGGVYDLVWNTLVQLAPGQTYARFRFASDPSEVVHPTGHASDGEVEDHMITIYAAPLPRLYYTYYFSNDGNEPVTTEQLFDSLPEGLVWDSTFTPIVGGGLSNVDIEYSNGDCDVIINEMELQPGNCSLTLATLEVSQSGVIENAGTLTLEGGETLEPASGVTSIILE